MRCGKDGGLGGMCGNGRVATRTNALWQRSSRYSLTKNLSVATRTNALWQSSMDSVASEKRHVATRTNALWQSRAIVVPEPETPKA